MPSNKIETWPRERLIPYARNARTHSPVQIAQVAASIKEFGWTNPILVGSDGIIIAGHARCLAAELLAIDEVPVIVLEHLTPVQRKALALADNKLALNAGWDEEMLRQELEELQSLGVELDLIGFDSREFDILSRSLLDDEVLDQALPVPEVATAQLGDLWLLGRHRVLCGDATDAASVERLLDGHQPILMVTDPPYGIELDTEWRDRQKVNKLGRAEPSYMKHRTEGHQRTSISGDTAATLGA
jgi:ParB-like chromosome segregation protein Spo0J